MDDAVPIRAGRWQRERADAWLLWATSAASERRERLEALAAAVHIVVRTQVYDQKSAQTVIRQLVPTLAKCDELTFTTAAEGVAYAIWHLVDRYARVVQAFDGLFRAGHLPMRKTRMAVLEVGAGPCPVIYAAIDYYSDLAKWCGATQQSLQPLTPANLHTIDRGMAWGGLVHAVSEALISLGAGRHPLPFETTYDDLRGYSVRTSHQEGIARAAARLLAEADFYDEPLDNRFAREQALKQRDYPPGAYDLIVLSNFLTTSRVTATFNAEIGSLAQSLTPGGVLLILGGTGPKYVDVYSDLRRIIEDESPLGAVQVFAQQMHAHPESQIHDLVAAHIVGGLKHAQTLAAEEFRLIRSALPADVCELKTSAVRFPTFTVLAFKNEHRRRRG